MEINIEIKDWPISPDRTNLYVWKDLNHLKSYYTDTIDNETIDSIAREIQQKDTIFKQRSYGMGKTMGKYLNDRCFCNLVEIFLIDRSEKALKRFFEKPI